MLTLLFWSMKYWSFGLCLWNLINCPKAKPNNNTENIWISGLIFRLVHISALLLTLVTVYTSWGSYPMLTQFLASKFVSKLFKDISYYESITGNKNVVKHQCMHAYCKICSLERKKKKTCIHIAHYQVCFFKWTVHLQGMVTYALCITGICYSTYFIKLNNRITHVKWAWPDPISEMLGVESVKKNYACCLF